MNREQQIDFMHRRAQAMMNLIPEDWYSEYLVDESDPDLMTTISIKNYDQIYWVSFTCDTPGFSVWVPSDESDPDPVFESNLDLDIVKFLETLK